MIKIIILVGGGSNAVTRWTLKMLRMFHVSSEERQRLHQCMCAEDVLSGLCIKGNMDLSGLLVVVDEALLVVAEG